MSQRNFKPGDSVSFHSKKRVLYSTTWKGIGYTYVVHGEVMATKGTFIGVRAGGATFWKTQDELTLDASAEEKEVFFRSLFED